MTMTKDQIQEAIIDRLEAMGQSCNSYHINHNDGVVRGLLWALTGEDHGPNQYRNTEDVLKLAGFITLRNGDKVDYYTPSL